MKITTGFNPIEASLLLQLCRHSLEGNYLLPKIPVQIPMPSDWVVSKRVACNKTGSLIKLWQNQVNKNQFALVVCCPLLQISKLTQGKNSRMAPAQIKMNGTTIPLAPDSNAKCNATLLHKFQSLLPLLIEVMNIPSRPFELYLTGHGNAAAITTLLLSVLYQNQPLIAQPSEFKTYLFGSPRIGNDAFSNYLNKQIFNNENIDSLAFHLINTNDIICELPQSLGLNPKVKRQVHSFRIQLLDSFSKLLFSSFSSGNREPYKSFGTPVLLSDDQNEFSEDPIYEHDLRRYYQLMQNNFPV